MIEEEDEGLDKVRVNQQLKNDYVDDVPTHRRDRLSLTAVIFGTWDTVSETREIETREVGLNHHHKIGLNSYTYYVSASSVKVP